jgi:hypothetical protein
LIRVGRVDCDIPIGPLDQRATEAMFVSFYGEDARPMIWAYTTSAHFKPRTGAELQLLFMTHDAPSAIARLRADEQPAVTEIRRAARVA